MSARKTRICPACFSGDCDLLPIPHPTQAMVSDGAILNRALRKSSCNECGYGFHAAPLKTADVTGFYSSNYDLGLRDRTGERVRASGYADQIIDSLKDHKIDSLLEFGCGTGSLLSLLKKRLNIDQAAGVEPSCLLAEAAKSEHAGMLLIEQAYAEDSKLTGQGNFDVCLSVNVAEHSLEPEQFLKACRKSVRPGGLVVVVCPDGETPGSELLFYDHVSSFSSQALAAFAARAGLSLTESKALSGNLSGFRLHIMADNGTARANTRKDLRLSRERAEYLESWAAYEANIENAIGKHDYAIFGAGEFGDLLAAYAPSVVDRAVLFVVDDPKSETVHGKPLIKTEAFLSDPAVEVLLAAVNERSWPHIRERFSTARIDIMHPSDLTSGRLKP